MMLLSLSSLAAAFCGAYVGDVDSAPTNNQSRIAIARDGRSTTLTMFNDVSGDLDSFGLIVPIPEVIGEDDVRLVDRELLDRLDSYSAPRLVEYTCEDLYPLEVQDTGWGTTSSGGGGGGCLGVASTDSAMSYSLDSAEASGGVTVEEQFDLGEYTAYVLSAEGSEGLNSWLEANGFAVSESTLPVLQEYIDGGSYFLALRVDLDRLPEGAEFLSPLQLAYSAREWTLPIKLGATSSAGVQDLVLFLVTPPETGRVAISNYTETALPEDECMVDVDDVGAYYAEKLTGVMGLSDDPALVGDTSKFAWVTEYSWDSGTCDPCPSEGPLTYDEVGHLGFDGHYGWHFTRLRARYTPGAVTQDVAFYTTNDTAQSQVRYMVHKWELESDLPICGGEAPENPGTCFSAAWWAARAEGEVNEDVPTGEVEAPKVDLCATMVLLVGPLALLRARRRS